MPHSARLPVRNRCACGHYPSQHMTVVPDEAGKTSGFHLAATGPCAVCSAGECSKFSPAPAAPSPE